ncbi:MAG: hypothetical protein ACYCQI_16945 [Gammaproteobacteria bacterium]
MFTKQAMKVEAKTDMPSEIDKKLEVKDEKFCTVRLYCLGKKIKNYEKIEEDVLVHLQTPSGPFPYVQNRTRYEVRNNITAAELFNSFPKDKTITVYKRLKYAYAASNSSTMRGAIKANSHERWCGKSGVYTDAFAIFAIDAIDAIVKLSDYATKGSFNIGAEQLKKIAFVHYDMNTFYKKKSKNQYLSSFNSKLTHKPELARRIHSILSMLGSYKESLYNFFNQSLINKIDIFIVKIKNAKSIEDLFYLCFEEKNQLAKCEYKNILSVICDTHLRSDDQLETTVINKLTGSQDSTSIEKAFSAETMSEHRSHMMDGYKLEREYHPPQ